MQPDYVRIQLEQASDRQAWKRFLPDRLLYWLCYRPSKMTVGVEELGDFQGLKVELPFTIHELSKCNQDWFCKYLSYLGEHYGIGESACFMDPAIQEHFQIEEESYEKYLKMLLLKETVNRMLHKRCITYRQARFVVVDDGSKQAEYVIADLAKDANYMTVITDRADALQRVADSIFLEQGLAITMMSEKDLVELKGDVIINLISDKEKITTRIVGACDLFDFGYTDQKALRLNQMNSQMHIFHTVKIKSMSDVIALTQLSQIFYYKDRAFQGFVNGRYDSELGVLFSQLWDSSFIEMVKVY